MVGVVGSSPIAPTNKQHRSASYHRGLFCASGWTRTNESLLTRTPRRARGWSALSGRRPAARGRVQSRLPTSRKNQPPTFGGFFVSGGGLEPTIMADSHAEACSGVVCPFGQTPRCAGSSPRAYQQAVQRASRRGGFFVSGGGLEPTIMADSHAEACSGVVCRFGQTPRCRRGRVPRAYHQAVPRDTQYGAPARLPDSSD
jgi:hypothetical protein